MLLVLLAIFLANKAQAMMLVMTIRKRTPAPNPTSQVCLQALSVMKIHDVLSIKLNEVTMRKAVDADSWIILFSLFLMKKLIIKNTWPRASHKKISVHMINAQPAGVMYVWYKSEASDTEHMNKSPPVPDPERALNVSIHTRDTVEIVNKIIVPT